MHGVRFNILRFFSRINYLRVRMSICNTYTASIRVRQSRSNYSLKSRGKTAALTMATLAGSVTASQKSLSKLPPLPLVGSLWPYLPLLLRRVARAVRDKQQRRRRGVQLNVVSRVQSEILLLSNFFHVLSFFLSPTIEWISLRFPVFWYLVQIPGTCKRVVTTP